MLRDKFFLLCKVFQQFDLHIPRQVRKFSKVNHFFLPTNNLNVRSAHDEVDKLKRTSKDINQTELQLGKFQAKCKDNSYNVKLLQELKLDNDALMELLLTNTAFIWKCCKVCKSDLKRYSQHRIHFLCERLNIDQQIFCAKLLKYKFVLTLSMKRIEEVTKVLLDYGIEGNEIFSDLWVLRCKAETVASRLELVKEAEVENLKPWMGRCKTEVFNEFIKRASTKQKLLGELSLEEYISERLGCSSGEVKEIIDREPQLQKTSVLKMKKILDFLFANGFSSAAILTGLPRVANRRIETINSRLQELNQIGLPPSLYVVSKSKREYTYYINKRKNKKINAC